MKERVARRKWAVVAGAVVFAMCASGGSPDGWTRVTPIPPGSGPVVRITGTVRYLTVEGGVFVISDAQGTRFNPTNLPETFRTNGLEIDADARRRDDLLSSAMVGPIVDLVRVRRRVR